LKEETARLKKNGGARAPKIVHAWQIADMIEWSD